MGALQQLYTNTTLTQIAIKRLSGKAQTSGIKSLAEEPYGSTVQTLSSTVIAQPVPNNPVKTIGLIQSASSGEEGTVVYLTFNLTGVNSSLYTGTSSSDAGSSGAIGELDTQSYIHAYAVSLPSDFESTVDLSLAGTTLSGSIPFQNGYFFTGSLGKLQLIPDYASNIVDNNPYTIEIFDQNGNPISSTGPQDWYIDQYSGILFVQDPTEENVPTTLKGFLYIGKYQDEISGGGTGEGFPYTGDAVITGSLLVSGSSPTVTVTGSVEVTNGITGSLYGTASFATGLVPELFEISELLSTGSGLVISSSGLNGSTHNAIRIGDTELVDFPNSFIINMPTSTALVFSGSLGPVNNFSPDDFKFYSGPNTNYVNFASNNTSFRVKKSGSSGDNNQNDAFRILRDTGNTFISGTLQVANLPQEDALVRVITSDATGSLAYTSSAYFASSATVDSISTTVNNNSSSISTLTSQTSSYITGAETGSMLEPYLLSSQTSSGGGGFNELVIDNGSGGGNLTVEGDTTINGNLYVYGAATELQVSKLQVEDRFILLNSGSVGDIYEGGIIVQTNANGSGSAIFYENSTNRWMVAQSSSVASDETNITVAGTTDYIVTVSASNGSPVGAPPNFGNGNDNVSVGQMYVDLTAHDIYIYA